MNIFALDNDPKTCAIYHGDKHVVKMVVESAQMLSAAHHCCQSNVTDLTKLYKPTHVNHPCNIWVRQSCENYDWLYKLFVELLQEYTYRYGKVHKSFELVQRLVKAPSTLPKVCRTPFAQAMPREYYNENGVVAYRNYYRGEKKNCFNWKKRPVPNWIIYPTTFEFS